MIELLKIFVIIGSTFQVSGSTTTINMVNFSGHAESAYFTGHILPGAVDTQTTLHLNPDSATQPASSAKFHHHSATSLSARYMLEGKDSCGQACRIYISNIVTPDTPPGQSHPTIVTDSKLLSPLCQQPLTGRLEMKKDTLVIRVLKEK